MEERYKVVYRGKTVVRRGASAQDAVERLCDQFGWRCRLRQYDADTRGMVWAECDVDPDGGINWDFAVLAYLMEKNEGVEK